MRQTSAAQLTTSLFRSPWFLGRPRVSRPYDNNSYGGATTTKMAAAAAAAPQFRLHAVARTTAPSVTASTGAYYEAASRGFGWNGGRILRSLSSPLSSSTGSGHHHVSTSSRLAHGGGVGRSGFLRGMGVLPLGLCVCGYTCLVGKDFVGTRLEEEEEKQQRSDDHDPKEDSTRSGSRDDDKSSSSAWVPSFDLKDLWSKPSEDNSQAGGAASLDKSTRGIHTSSSPSAPPSSSSLSSSTGWDEMYARLARDAMAFVTGGSRSRDAALQDLVEQVRTKRDKTGGDVEDTTSFTSILTLLRQQVVGDMPSDDQSHDEIQAELQRVADKFFGNLQLSTTFPSALWGYLEHEDERKNPSWKRRVHRFCPGIYMDQLEEFYRGLLLAYFAYGDTPDEIRMNLEKRGYELLHCDLSSAPGKPAHYVAVQRKHESTNSWFSLLSSSSASPFSSSALPVVIVVRGTKTLADAMTDLLCDSCEYRGGRAHSYIVTSGKYLAEKQAPLLKELATLSGLDLQVTLIGHSLGAGAATIAGIELANRDKDPYNVNVVGFGCPALLSRDLAESVSSFVTTIINDSDVVPRMSGASIANLLRDVSAFDWFPYARRDIKYALDELFPSKIAKSILETVEPPLKSLVESSRQEPPSPEERVTPELYPPGRCIHFYSDGIGTSAAVVRNDFFKEIDVSRRMIEDHLFFTGYQRMMLTVMRDYRQDHNFKFQSDE